MICVICCREYRRGASWRLGAAHATCFGRQYVGVASVTFAVGSQRGSLLCTVNAAVPPPPSVPWQFAHSSDFVLSYAGDWSLANNVAPRSTDRSWNPLAAAVSRNGSQMK